MAIFRGEDEDWNLIAIGSYPTKPLVNTPLKNPSSVNELTEVEVIDPMHPLFGRCFSVVFSANPRPGRAYVAVTYRGEMRLRIPLSVTQVMPPQSILGTKLTLESVTELVTLIEACEVLCLFPPAKSGPDSAPPSKPPSEPNSSPSFRR